MVSKVQIANQALLRLGAQRITSFTDQTVEAKAINSIYEQVVEDVISMGSWPSAKKRAVLAQLVDLPTYGFMHAYQLPVGCIKVLNINECRLGDIRYRIENGVLLCDEAAVDVLYLSMLNEAGEYDSYLRQAITWQLCYELAYLVMGDKSAAANMLQTADNKVLDLLNNASSQGSSSYIPSDDYIDVRGRP